MTAIIINLTLKAVVEAIDQVLASYPSHSQQHAFAAPDLRQKLVAYVLSRVPNCYSVIDEDEHPIAKTQLPYCFFGPQVNIKEIVHQGIQDILRVKAEAANVCIPNSVDLDYAPSSWFG